MKALAGRLEGSGNLPVRIAGPVSDKRISRFEEAYSLTLPEQVRSFVSAYGDLTARDAAIGWRLLGLSDDLERRPTIASTLYLARTSGPFPAYLLPVEILAGNQLACVRLDGSPDPAVLQVDLEDPRRVGPRLSRRFSDFANEWLNDVYAVGTVLRRSRDVEADIRKGRRAPDQAHRPSDWRSYRICSQDVIVALAMLTHDRDASVTRVAALPISTLPDFPRLEPARVAMGVVLCDAYRSGGTLEIRFQSGKGRQGRPLRVPAQVTELLRAAGCHVHPRSTAISAADAATLFRYCARLPPSIHTHLGAHSTGLSSAVSYAALSGLWSAVHLEVLLTGADDPELLLRGGVHPLRRLGHLRDLEILRTAVMADTLLRTFQQLDPNGRYDSEDDLVEVGFQFADGLLRYTSDTPLSCTWWEGPAPEPERQLNVLPCAATKDTLVERLPSALARAASQGAALLVARDFLSLPEADRDQWLRVARLHDVPILVAPDYVLTLDSDAGRRLARARTTRL